MATHPTLSPQQFAQIALQIKQDPQLQKITQEWLALDKSSANAPSSQINAIQAKASALKAQYQQLAAKYMPDGYEATGIQNNDGAPLIFSKESHEGMYVTEAMIVAALGAGAISAVAGGGSALPSAAAATPTGTSTAAAPLASSVIGTGSIGPIAGGTGLSTAVPTVAAPIASGLSTAADTGLLPSTQIGTGSIAPITGGTGLAKTAINGKSILDTAKDVGDALTSIGTGRAQGAQTEAGITQSQDRNAIGLYNAENNANANANDFSLAVGNQDLNRSNAANTFGLNRGNLANANASTDLAQRNFALQAPGARAGNAVRGDILSRAQDVSFSGVPSNIPVPTISGGLRPSMFSGDTRALGADMTSQARAAQAKGDTFAPLPDLQTYQAPQGGLPTYKQGPAPPTLTGLPSGTATTGLSNAGAILNLAPTVWNGVKQFLPK